MIKIFLQKSFGIRSGEVRISLLMQLYIFLIITTLLIVKPTINALFLSKLTSDALPNAYLLVALVAIGSSFFYNKALKKFSLLKIVTATLIVSAAIFLSLKFLLNYDYFSTELLYFYYVWVAIFALLTTSQFWVLANLVFNIREAKRLFGFIGAGAITGGIFGGYLTNLLAPIIGNDNLMVIASLILLGCVPLLQYIWKKKIKALGYFRQKQRSYATNESSFKLILKSKHLTYIAGIVGVSVITAKLVDFQFSDLASKAISDPDDLASFFGFWFSTFNLVSLMIQLFLTRKIVGVWGVASTLILLPVGILVTVGLFIVFPELWVVILMKSVDGSLKQSINKAASEMLVLPVPTDIKNKTKSFIDVVVDSIATGIAGCLLIFVIKGLDFGPVEVSMLILALILIWFYFIYKVRKTYFQSFRQNLINFSDKHHLSKNKKRNHVSTNATILKVLEEGEESEILYMLSKINEIKDKRLKLAVVFLLDHPLDTIKAAAIRNLYLLDKGTAVEKVEELVNQKDDEVVLAAMQYLLTHTDINDLKIFDTYLNHDNKYIASAALFCLAKESRDNQKLAERYSLDTRLEKGIEAVNLPSDHHRINETVELIKAIGFSGMPKYYSFIKAHFNNKNEEVIKAAIEAAGHSAHILFVDDLLGFLETKDFREEAEEALHHYGSGVIKMLLKRLKNNLISENTKRFIPNILSRFNNQESVNTLFTLLRNKDIIIRLEAAKALQEIKEKNKGLKFSKKDVVRLILSECKLYHSTLIAMELQKKITKNYKLELVSDTEMEEYSARNSLIEILEKRLDHGLQQIFTLLELEYNSKDVNIAYNGIKSEKQEVRANAIEFLDTLLQPNLRHTLLPLVENTILSASNQEIDSNFNVPSEYKCFQMLLKGQDVRIKLAVLYLLRHIEDKNYLKLVHRMVTDKDIRIRNFATLAVENLKKVD